MPKPAKGEPKTVTGTKPPPILGACLCGDITVEIDFPAFWAWHDHSTATQHAHGAAYATYIGCWRSRVRIADTTRLTRFEQPTGARSFCARCGTPILYERAHSPRMVNLPRALFTTRTGREPRYHIALEQAPDWAYNGEPLGPLKGFPGVLWSRPKSRRRPNADIPLGTEPAMLPPPPATRPLGTRPLGTSPLGTRKQRP